MKEQSIAYGSAGRTFDALLFEPDLAPGTARAAVLVFHGGAGLGEHERRRACMLAELGYVAMAPDLFGETFASRERGMAVILGLVTDPPALRSRLFDALSFLRSVPGVDASRIAAIGFCFGGLAALELARSGADVRAVVSFHGGLTARAPAAPGGVKADILVCTGALDPFVPREDRSAFEDEMTRAGASWQLEVYSNALHGFTERGTSDGDSRRPGTQYDEAADRRSWRSMRGLLEEALAPTTPDAYTHVIASGG
jgi:dienelactone hydrolase